MANDKPFRKDFFDENIGTKWILFSFYELPAINKVYESFTSAQALATEAASSVTDLSTRLGRSAENNPEAQKAAEKSKEVEASITDRLAEVAKKGQTKSKINVENYKGSIIMPMINQAQETMTQNFSTETGPVESLLRGVAGPIVDVALVASRTFSQLSGASGIVINSDYNSVYTGGTLRQFSASWSVIPKSEDEARRLFEVIQKFKEVSSPKKELGSLFLAAPMRTKIEFSNTVLNDAMQFTDMVITSIDVNYSLTGFMETFRNGSPKAISLTIQFQDSKMKTREDYAEAKSKTISAASLS